MNDFERYVDQLRDENKVLGVVLWNVLESHIDYDCAGVGNQPQSKDYDATKPQSIDFMFGCTSHGISVFEHPIGFYPFKVSVPLDPTVKPLKHIGTFTVTRVESDGPSTQNYIVTEHTYRININRLTKLLPHLTDTKIAPLMLSMLDYIDSDEYLCKKDDTGMWED